MGNNRWHGFQSLTSSFRNHNDKRLLLKEWLFIYSDLIFDLANCSDSTKEDYSFTSCNNNEMSDICLFSPSFSLYKWKNEYVWDVVNSDEDV